MSFEVLYKYHEKSSDGYNREEVKELKEKVGNPFDDTSLDTLATSIISQLARRDIWIFDVEVYEFKKQKINFRETKGGVVIKNKKFSLNGNSIIAQNEEEPEQKPKNIPVPAVVSPPAQKSNVPLKWVMLDPDERMQSIILRSGFNVSPNKRYPVYSETPHPTKIGITILAIKDNSGKDISVSDEYFIRADHILQNGFSKPIDVEEMKLSHDSYLQGMDMIDIRH